MSDFKSEYKRAMNEIEPDPVILEQLRSAGVSGFPVEKKRSFFARHRAAVVSAACAAAAVTVIVGGAALIGTGYISAPLSSGAEINMADDQSENILSIDGSGFHTDITDKTASIIADTDTMLAAIYDGSAAERLLGERLRLSYVEDDYVIFAYFADADEVESNLFLFLGDEENDRYALLETRAQLTGAAALYEGLHKEVPEFVLKSICTLKSGEYEELMNVVSQRRETAGFNSQDTTVFGYAGQGFTCVFSEEEELKDSFYEVFTENGIRFPQE